MTQGSIVKNILLFAFPLLLGNLFQQLYNMVDVWVIGQTGNVEAYSAVGNVGPIINMLIGFFSGLASGAGVIISQYYGAKNEKKANEVAHTSMAMTLALAVVLTV
ncbi:MAG: MATE family efflux transporter, partial [Clostridia bacterium]|nr:MATE family efflux transporter [Clostridia bacterium]